MYLWIYQQVFQSILEPWITESGSAKALTNVKVVNNNLRGRDIRNPEDVSTKNI